MDQATLAVIGDVLSNAVGVAISPLPIVAVILILFSPAARVNGFAFMVGWIAGVVTVVGLFCALGPVAGGDDPGWLIGTLQLLFGALFLFLAWKQWQGRPRAGEEPQLPGMFAAVDSFTPVRALIMGFLLGSVNPKNLSLSATAGGTIGAAELGGGSLIVVLAVFVAIASTTVALPVFATIVAPGRTKPLLDHAKGWLIANNSTVMMVLFLVLGTKMIGDGLGLVG